MATLFYQDGTHKRVFPNEKEKGFTLEECYKLIGCRVVELLRWGDDDLVCDEEGMLKEGARLNMGIWRRYGIRLVGNVLRCEPGEFN